MKLKERIKFRNWGIVRAYRDIENFLDWRRVIKKESLDKNSKYNRWKLQHTKLYDIYFDVSLEEADLMLPQAVQRLKVIEMLNPLHRYLDEELGFVDCLNIELNQYEDDEGNLTLTYRIVYTFRWTKFSILWLLKILSIAGIATYLVVRYDIVSIFKNFISNLF